MTGGTKRGAKKRKTHGSITPEQLLDMNAVIVTSRAGNIVNGCTVSWVTRLSFDPPLIGVSIGKTRFTRSVIIQSGWFVINILDREDWKVCKYFGTVSGKSTNKFNRHKYYLTEHKNPVLEKAIAYIECEVKHKFDVGDHLLFVGEVVDERVIREGTVLTRELLRDKGV